jgi:hypothetical protein
MVRGLFRLLVAVSNDQSMWIDEARGPKHQIYIVASHLFLNDVDLFGDDVAAAEGQVFHRDVLFEPVFGSIHGALMKPGEVENGFAERFAGNGAGVDADTPDNLGALDDADFFAEFGGLHRGLLAGGAGADH